MIKNILLNVWSLISFVNLLVGCNGFGWSLSDTEFRIVSKNLIGKKHHSKKHYYENIIPYISTNIYFSDNFFLQNKIVLKNIKAMERRTKTHVN